MARAGECQNCGAFTPYLVVVEPRVAEPAAGPARLCAGCAPGWASWSPHADRAHRTNDHGETES